MPPKVKIPREAIIEKAFELTKVYGFEKVTARLLASELKCSTQPVFYAFHNMEELKEEVYKKRITTTTTMKKNKRKDF